MTHRLLTTVLLLFALSPGGSANPIRSDHIEVELIAETVSVQPGTAFWVALRLNTDEHWHTYWRNPGDSGLATTIEWQLPAGASVSGIHWPYPQRFSVQNIASFGYGSEGFLMAAIRPPSYWPGGDTFPITARASWLVCNDICIPGRAELSLNLPITTAPPALDLRWRNAFKSARARIPIVDGQWQTAFTEQDGQVYLQIEARRPVFAAAKSIEFFPGARNVVANSAQPELIWDNDILRLKQARSAEWEAMPARLGGVVVVTTATKATAYRISAAPGLEVVPALFDKTAQTHGPSTQDLLIMGLLAMAGGLLLNLMPCVFPVISLKAISLVETVHNSHHAQRMHGVAYTLGAMVFFTLVAGVLILLRASGSTIGWGFQLQSPWFVALLAYLLFVLGLSFSGFLELGSRFMGIGDSLASRPDHVGSFFTGALAAVVASPCTAPFMGTAIAFALAQPSLSTLVVFAALGFGMALPFLLIAFIPPLANVLPKPGAWMMIFKQMMAFPLYLTAVWLLWVLGRQTSATGMAAVLVGMVLLMFGLWTWQLRQKAKGRWHDVCVGITVATLLATFLIVQSPLLTASKPGTLRPADHTGGGLAWQPYDAEQLAKLRAEATPVFVNMTADWCISCIANERVSLSFPTVKQAFKDNNIVPMKGDWTNRDPEITRVLERFGRNGVPLYVFYPASSNAEPIVLAQLLTPMYLLDVIKGDDLDASEDELGIVVSP